MRGDSDSYLAELRRITGYDPRKMAAFDTDDRDMEVNQFARVEAEERRTARIGGDAMRCTLCR